MATTETKPPKPLGRKAYGHIGHLPGSRLGSGDHKLPEGQARICTEKVRNKWDVVIVQQKVDGSCCAVAKVDGAIVPLSRAGYHAETSPYYQHLLFAEWVYQRRELFAALLDEGERIVGEWLAQAHGTRYILPHEPFVVFDLIRGDKRAIFDEFIRRTEPTLLPTPELLTLGAPVSIDNAMELASAEAHGAADPVEGAVWRVESQRGPDAPRYVDFLGKYVRPDKQDGCYLPEVGGGEPVWNWHSRERPWHETEGG